MPVAFIIMQIGNSDLDQVCEKAIVPAIKACGFDPQRVDKHNKGGLLKSEIIQYIQTAEYAQATTTNGSVTAVFGSRQWPEPLKLATYSGDDPRR